MLRALPAQQTHFEATVNYFESPKPNHLKGPTMNRSLQFTGFALLISVASATVYAQATAQKTRAEVQAELAEARRTGDFLVEGDSGLKLNELYPWRYPQQPVVLGKTRAQVQAELAEARRNGELLVEGESGLKMNEAFPSRYPKQPVVVGKTRAQVLAELAEALRTGDIVANGELGLKLNELYPQEYPKKSASKMVELPASAMGGQ